MSQQSITLVFQDAGGNSLAGGSVKIRLSVDASVGTSGGPSVMANRTTVVTLNGSGSATILIWPNDVLFPVKTVYFVTAYSAQGQPAWSGQMSVDSSGNVTWVTT